MSKIIDITDKLAFDENPVIKIRDVELEINTEAENMIKIMALTSETPGAKEIVEMCRLVFTEESVEKLKALQLKFNDYVDVVMTAIGVASGSYDESESGE
ncbi:MAG: hypothetical protein K6G85_04425 [Eubacterium sp.]|nr:hypothetical protein [Eubacterium sp.]